MYITPIMSLCHGISTERYKFRLPFPAKKASRAYLGNTIHETQRKKKRLSYAGTPSNENHANFAFLLLYSSIPISPFLTLQISLSFANFSHSQLGEFRKKLAGELNFFVIFVCIKGYQSSDSFSFKEAFVKRVSNLRR